MYRVHQQSHFEILKKSSSQTKTGKFIIHEISFVFNVSSRDIMKWKKTRQRRKMKNVIQYWKGHRENLLSYVILSQWHEGQFKYNIQDEWRKKFAFYFIEKVLQEFCSQFVKVFLVDDRKFYFAALQTFISRWFKKEGENSKELTLFCRSTYFCTSLNPHLSSL